MSLDRSEWDGLIVGNRMGPTAVITLTAPVEQWQSGVSGAFKALASDGRLWWVKPPGQQNLGKALVTEYVVGAVGKGIGAPTCNAAIIEIPQSHTGWQYRGNETLRAGYGHATEHVPDAIEERPQLKYRTEDDNHRRHAGVYALYDWCFGSDQQWLHSTTNHMTIYSHDHGWYFPPSGPDWTSQSLIGAVDLANTLAQDPTGVDGETLSAIAEALESVTRDLLRDTLVQVPSDWPVTDEELETLGWFLERRAPKVAERIKGMV